MRLYISYGRLSHFEDPSFECNVFDNIHFAANFLLVAIISDKPYVGTLKETLWILAEEEDSSPTYLFFPILYDNIISI